MNTFNGAYLRKPNKCACYTTEDCFEKKTSPTTLHLIEKGLEERTETEFLRQTYILVYTKKKYLQNAHVDLSESVFVPHKPLGFIMHLPLCSEGTWLRIWERDGVLRLISTGYLIHILFGTVLFLRSDIVHSGIFGLHGNLWLHCAFQPASYPGDKTKLLHLDPKASGKLSIGDLDKVVYARYRHPQEEVAVLPICADHNVPYFKEYYYLKEYLHHVRPRCDDATGYSDLLPFDSASSGKKKSSVTQKKSSKRKTSSTLSAIIPLANRKDPTDSVINAGLTVAAKIDSTTKRRQSINESKFFEEGTKTTKPIELFDDSEDSDESAIGGIRESRRICKKRTRLITEK